MWKSTRRSLFSVRLVATLFCGALLCLAPCLAEADPAAYGFVTHLPIDPGGARGVLGVSLVTGARQTASDFNNPAQGPVGYPRAMAPGLAPNELLVAAVSTPIGSELVGKGMLLRVNVLTGTRTSIWNFGGTPNYAYQADALARDLSGRILVIVATDFFRLYRLDPVANTLTLLSDFTDSSQGYAYGNPRNLAQHPSGAILVTNGGLGNGVLLRVDPVSGMRSVLSDFGDPSQGPLGHTPHDVAVGPLGQIIVVTAGTSQLPAAVFRVDIQTGVRELVSDLSDPSQGPVGCIARQVAIEAAGSILVLDSGCLHGTPPPAVYRVSPTTGQRVLVSNLTQANQGQVAPHPADLALYSCGFCPVIFQELPHLRIITGECSGCSPTSLPPLLRQIDAALELVKATQVRPAVDTLEEFIRLTEQSVRTRDIPGDVGRALTTEAQAVITELRTL